MGVASAENQNGQALPAVAHDGTCVTLAIGTGATSVALNAGLHLLWPSIDCHVSIGPDPTATWSHHPLTGRVREAVQITAAAKISVIAAVGAGTGTLWITPVPAAR